ncbi:MAG TPA: choice-of-anchor J domain-containing protein [Bacteroidales bacterium]|nr:choice-of-anchor J domain-containing protein [Bacteroidales bacterium]
MKKMVLTVLCIVFACTFVNAQLLNESFEGTFPPAGWTVRGGNLQGGENWGKGISTMYFQCHHSGTVGAVSESYVYPDEVTPDNWLITPEIPVQNNDSIVFFVMPSSVQYPAEHFELWLSMSGNEIADFTEKLYEITFSASDADDWNRISISLSDWNGSSVYLAFVHNNCSGQNMLMLDDVSIVEGESTTHININELEFNDGVCYFDGDYLHFYENYPTMENVAIYGVSGICYYRNAKVNSRTISLPMLKSGLYIIAFSVNDTLHTYKLLKY